MRVYQTREDGILIGYEDAQESPLQPGVYLIPAGCVTVEPPEFAEPNRARWDGETKGWIVEPTPQPETAAEPEPAVPSAVSDRQFAQALAETGRISWAEAQAWGARGEIPAELLAAVERLDDPLQRNRAVMFLSAATWFERQHPMTTTLAQALGWNDADLDALWLLASGL